jgi:hypothetical protein
LLLPPCVQGWRQDVRASARQQQQAEQAGGGGGGGGGESFLRVHWVAVPKATRARRPNRRRRRRRWRRGVGQRAIAARAGVWKHPSALSRLAHSDSVPAPSCARAATQPPARRRCAHVVRCGAVVRGAQLLLLLLLCREWTDVAAFAPHSCVVPRTWGCLRGRAGRTRRSSHGSWAARSGACGKRRREPCPKPATTGQASRRPRCGSRGRGSDVLVTVTSAHRLSLPEATPTC